MVGMPSYNTGHCFLCSGKSHELLLRVIADRDTGELQSVYLCPVCRHYVDWMITANENPARKNETTKNLENTPRFLLRGGD